MARLELSLLGPMQVTLDGLPVADFGTDKTRALLAYLFVEGSQAHRRETLTGLLWPDQPEEAARTSLRQAIYKLRRVLGEQEEAGALGLLQVGPQVVQVDSGADYRLDVAEFSELVAACKAHRHRKAEHCSSCRARLLRAVELYRGDFFQGFFLEDSQPFDEWLLLKREGSRRNLLWVLASLARRYESRGEYEQALHYAYRQLELEPWREEVHRRVMGLLAVTGQRSAALAQYETCRRVLAVELNAEPSAETVALYERLKGSSDFGSSPDSIQTPNSKLQNRQVLPQQLSPFIGRTEELARILDRLDSPDYRLTTLLGPGGAGKTRLALQAAYEQVGAFKDGVYWVSLAPITSHELLTSTIAQVVGLHFDATEDPKAQLLKYLADKEMLLVLDNFEHLLGGPQAIDLLSSILKSAPGISLLITSRERLGLQAEFLLDLSGLPFPDLDDGTWSASSIVHPSHAQDPSSTPDDLASYAAIQLFVERAQQTDSAFALSEKTAQGVVDVCRLVDGLPLGIVLAAAWVRHLSPDRIASSIRANLDFLTSAARDTSQQHASLRAVFNHSWNLLSEEEKRLFRDLSVFRGGWEEEAAERITEASLFSLLSLVDKSLLRRDASGRFDLHEVLRQYASEKLDEVPRERNEVERRHAQCFLELAEVAETHLLGAEQGQWLERLEREHDNLRAALRWARAEGAGENEEVEVGLRLGGALWRFWYFRSHYSEGRAQLAAVLEMPFTTAIARRAPGTQAAAGELPVDAIEPEEAEGPVGASGAAAQSRNSVLVRARITALNGAGVLASLQGDHSVARAFYEESLALSREIGDKQSMASSLNNLGILAHQQGNFGAGRTLQEEALALRREMGDTKGIAASLNNLGLVAQEGGDLTAAHALHEEALALRRELRDTLGIASSLGNLGLVAQEGGDFTAARALYQESLALRGELGDKGGMAEMLSSLGLVAQEQGDYDAAWDLYEQGLRLSRELGYKWNTALLLNNLGRVAQERGDFTAARAVHKESLALRSELGDKRGVAASLAGLGALAVGLKSKAEGQAGETLDFRPSAFDQVERAVQLFGAVAGLLERIGGVLDIGDRLPYERNVAAARSLLGEEAFEIAWAAGRAMSIEEAIAYALALN